MDMEVTAWMSMHHAMNARDARPFKRATMQRIWAFAARHHRRLALFLALSVVGAVLAVATPVLAGEVVNAIPEWDDVAAAAAALGQPAQLVLQQAHTAAGPPP